MEDEPQWFIKNGCFSGKFDFSHCITNAGKIRDDFTSIQYDSACFGTGGLSEIVLREVIDYNPQTTATIYNGMPLRTEIRVFYDFDKREVLYSHNYWDYDYCRPNIRARADQIIFDALKDEILTGYEKYRKQAEDAVAKAMRGVNMTGKWSIDLLLEEQSEMSAQYQEKTDNDIVDLLLDEKEEKGEAPTFWLIDMAIAESSAYWKGDI